MRDPMRDPMRGTTRAPPPAAPPGLCEIRLCGHLDDRWAERLGGLIPRRDHDGTTLLRGPLTDAAALHGVLAAIRDLGPTLLAVRWTVPAAPPERKRS